jgi:simple sugar transport system ATP-binding protein
MVGRSIAIDREEGRNRNIVDETILDIKDLQVAMPGERVKGVDLTVKKGEIVGIGGLAGQGKLGIANGIMGIFPAKGDVVFKGKKINFE